MTARLKTRYAIAVTRRLLSGNVSIVVSLVALAISIYNFILQNLPRHDVTYKLSGISIFLPEEDYDALHSVIFRFTLSAFNVGNRSAALEEIALYMVSTASSVADEEATCSPGSFTTIPPKAGSTEDRFSAKPEVIADRSILAREFAFDMLYNQRNEDVAALTGALCIRITAANSGGGTVVRRHVLLKNISLQISRKEKKREIRINGILLPSGQQIRDVREPITGFWFWSLL